MASNIGVHATLHHPLHPRELTVDHTVKNVAEFMGNRELSRQPSHGRHKGEMAIAIDSSFVVRELDDKRFKTTRAAYFLAEDLPHIVVPAIQLLEEETHTVETCLPHPNHTDVLGMTFYLEHYAVCQEAVTQLTTFLIHCDTVSPSIHFDLLAEKSQWGEYTPRYDNFTLYRDEDEQCVKIGLFDLDHFSIEGDSESFSQDQLLRALETTTYLFPHNFDEIVETGETYAERIGVALDRPALEEKQVQALSNFAPAQHIVDNPEFFALPTFTDEELEALACTFADSHPQFPYEHQAYLEHNLRGLAQHVYDGLRDNTDERCVRFSEFSQSYDTHAPALRDSFWEGMEFIDEDMRSQIIAGHVSSAENDLAEMILSKWEENSVIQRLPNVDYFVF